MNNQAYRVGETFSDYPDDNYAVIVYLTGCSHQCQGCHNPQYQKHIYAEKEKIVSDILAYFVDLMAVGYFSERLVISGGDPLHEDNIKTTEYICDQMQIRGIRVCIYTGYDIEYVKNNFGSKFDFIKCGKYIREQHRDSGKDNEGIVLASSNQEFYDGNYKQISNKGILKWNN